MASHESANRLIRINDPGTAASWCTNQMSSTKYSVYNFLCKNLAEQFSRHINRYFLLIASLQLWSDVTPVHPVTTWAPLIFIFAVTAAKEAVDDCQRASRDRELNNRQYTVVDASGQHLEPASSICVGTLLLLRDGDEVPCDVALLQAGPAAECLINTASLDGESDLKRRRPPLSTCNVPIEDLHKLRSVVECGPPDNDLHHFDAALRENEQRADSLSMQNLLPHGTILRGSSVVGVAVYTGHDTKLCMSQQPPPSKYAQADETINKISVGIFLFQLAIVATFGAAGSVYRYDDAEDTWYLDYASFSGWWGPVIIPLRFLLLNSYMIPISLKVSLDITKLVQARLICWDLTMYDEHRDIAATALSTAIAEDLGQVRHVLTDKTGTLTCNEMHMKATVLPDGTVLDSPQQQSSGQEEQVLQLHRGLALCHTLRCDLEAAPTGSSPDEMALVDWAARSGVICIKSNHDSVTLQEHGTIRHYKVHAMLDFSPERRRMSVLLQCLDSGTFVLISKGADDKMLCRLAGAAAQVVEPLELLAGQGLRTLVVAHKVVGVQEANQWLQQLADAQLTPGPKREERTAEVYDLLEQQMDLLGATAVEDKLQDNVPETISQLQSAGVRLWMLTGDKLSTALQIGANAGLYQKGKECFNLAIADCHATASINGAVMEEWDLRGPLVEGGPLLFDPVADFLERQQVHGPANLRTFIAIDSASLETSFRDESALNSFKKLVMLQSVKVVLCCRVTPRQKGSVVAMVKKASKQITLAIGDGANDVDMIREAHVGVGIVGREGMHAARASDYSFSQFQYLAPLMLVHGHLSCYRTAMTAQYCFYKSFFLCCVQLLFATGSAFSGSSWLNSFALTAYNTILTGLLPFLFLWDCDYPIAQLRASGALYRDVAQGSAMNGWTMLLVALLAVAGALLVSMPHLTSANQVQDQESSGMVVFSSTVIVQVLVVAMATKNITLIHLGIFTLTLVLFFASSAAASNFVMLEMHGVMPQLYGSAEYWLTVLLCVSMAVLLTGLGIKLSASFRMLATKASTEQHQVSAVPLTCDQQKDQISQHKMDPQDKHVEKGKQTNDNDEQNILVKIEALVDNGQVGLVAQM